MTIKELTKGLEVWCWWLSRNLYFISYNSILKKYRFDDAAGAQFYFSEEQLKKLIIK